MLKINTKKVASEDSYKFLLTSQRLRTAMQVQKHILEIQIHNSQANLIGSMIIEGLSSVKNFMLLPIKLFRAYYGAKRVTPPVTLGGKAFTKFIRAWEKGGMKAADALLDKFSLAPSMRADAYTALARSLMGKSAGEAVQAARRAYEADPRPYRLKWLAFREYEAGGALKAGAMLDMLPDDQPMSLSEAHLLLHISKDSHNSLLFQYHCAKNKKTHKKNFASKMKTAIYIDHYDDANDAVRIFYDVNYISYEAFFIDDVERIPAHIKTMRHKESSKYAFRRYVTILLERNDDEKVLSASVNGIKIPFAFQKLRYAAMPIGAIRAVLSPEPVDGTGSLYENCWLFIDRDTQADDNAEHLYRYVARQHPEIKAFFALRETSHDWHRLKNEGFDLLPWGSEEYYEALQVCKKIVSSHINTDMTSTKDGAEVQKQYVFLQHGVIKDTMPYFNRKKIDLFFTTTNAEWESIAGEKTRYKFGPETVRCLGLPRHDALLANDVPLRRQILVMPTWRRNLTGKYIEGHVRELNSSFNSSFYLRAWSSFLCSERLYSLLKMYDYTIAFFPHAMMQPYIHEFKVPEHIHTVLHTASGIQELFKSSALMVTDFSSVAFEMAYLQRPVIYYQFDEEEFFAEGTKQWDKGYFDYREHGFGPVVTEEKALLDSLEALLARDTVPEDTYMQRINSTFAYRDRNNCARAFEAICDLDKPYPEGHINLDVLRSYTRAAIDNGAVDVALARAELLNSLDATEESEQLLQEAKALAARDV